MKQLTQWRKELEIYFKNGVPIALMEWMEWKKRDKFTAIEGWEVGNFRSLKDNLRGQLQSYKGFEIVKETDYELTSSFKSVYDGKQRAYIILEDNLPGNKYRILSVKEYLLNQKSYTVGNVDLTTVNQYDLKKMIEIFLLDLKLKIESLDEKCYR